MLRELLEKSQEEIVGFLHELLVTGEQVVRQRVEKELHVIDGEVVVDVRFQLVQGEQNVVDDRRRGVLVDGDRELLPVVLNIEQLVPVGHVGELLLRTIDQT